MGGDKMTKKRIIDNMAEVIAKTKCPPESFEWNRSNFAVLPGDEAESYEPIIINKAIEPQVNQFINVMKNKIEVKAILLELEAAETKHPNWPDNIFEQVTILQEEAGEVSKAVLQWMRESGNIHEVRKELRQTAAMCIRMLKNLKDNATA